MVFCSIQERFAAQVARAPDAVAVVQDGHRRSYRELDRLADRLAGHLARLGAGPGVPVGILMRRSAEVIVAFLAVVKAGAYYVPLHESHPPERVQAIVDGGRIPVLLADESMRARLPRVEHVVFVEDAPAVDVPPVPPPTGPGDTANVIYTSGSTGQPKGVAITHGGVLDFVADSCWDSGWHDRLLMVAPHAFSVSTYEVWVPLLRGGRIVVAPPGPPGVDSLRRLVAEEGITGLHLTAGLFRVLVEEAPDCLAGVREVLTGGDVIAPSAVRRALERCPDLVVRGMYGATETTLFVATWPMRAPYRPDVRVPIGRPMDGVHAYVLDERLTPAALGATGELYIGGGRLAGGYVERPDLTAERFVADPFRGGGERMYRTGDLVRLTPDGVIEFVGRAGTLVKIRGFRVEPAEVEAALAAHPGVAHAAVLAHGADPGDQRLAGYVVPRDGTLDVADLRTFAADALPDYMVPSALITLDALPLTPNGKLDRAALPAPDLQRPSSSYRAPRNARQEALCRIFAEVLDVPEVGIDDSFFDLDGQSLLAIRLVNRVRTELSAVLSVGDLFNAPTVAELDKLLDADATP